MDGAGATSEWTTASDGEAQRQRRAQGAVWGGSSCVCSVCYGQPTECAVVVSGTCLRYGAYCLGHLIAKRRCKYAVQWQRKPLAMDKSEGLFCNGDSRVSALRVSIEDKITVFRRKNLLLLGAPSGHVGCLSK